MYGDAAIEGSTDALTPRVSYRVEGNEVHLRVHLVQGDRTIGDRTITTGTEAQAAAHAATETIVELVRKKR